MKIHPIIDGAASLASSLSSSEPSSTQHEAWAQALREAQRLKDGLGRSLDREIIETVAVLRLMGFSTTMSCGGHLSRITGGPYVRFCSPAAKKYHEQYKQIDPAGLEGKRLASKAYRANLRERQKLLPYLEKFYRGRDVPYGQRLTLRSPSMSSTYLYCQSAELARIFDQAERREILTANRQEMAAFTVLLKQVVLSPYLSGTPSSNHPSPSHLG